MHGLRLFTITRGWKDVTTFTDNCDVAHRPSVHLLRWRRWSRIFVLEPSRTAPRAAARDERFCRSWATSRQSSPVRWSVHWISTGQHP